MNSEGTQDPQNVNTQRERFLPLTTVVLAYTDATFLKGNDGLLIAHSQPIAIALSGIFTSWQDGINLQVSDCLLVSEKTTMSAKSEVTIYDIARELDLSPSTISRALSGLSIVHKDTRSKILEKAQHLGYRRNQFASRLRSQKTHVLATVVPQLNTFFISNIVSGAEVTARQSGYNMVVNQSLQNRELLAANIEHLNKSGVDGLLVASSEIENYAHDLSAIGIPLIIIEACAELRSRSKNRTTLCNFEMAYQLTRHLAKRGCRRIAFISNASDTVRHSDILRGYRRALYDHELNNDMILIGSIGQSGIDMSREMLSGTSLPDGIIFSSDIIAALSIPEFSQPGEMKKDNRVSGFSEQPSFLNTESFSILDDAQLVHLGKVAMAILISLVENTPE